MNLLETVAFLDGIQAGGPGSGPNAPCPQCGPHTGKAGNVGFHEKDIVKLKIPETLWNTKTGNIDKFPAGKLKAVVTQVLPKVGSNPQMLKVNILTPSKHHEQDNYRFVPADKVDMHKSVGSTIVPEDVQKSKIKIQYLSYDGAKVTVVKTQEGKEVDKKTIEDMARMPSYFKGSFTRLEKVGTAPKEIAEEYMPDKYQPHTSYIYDSEQKDSGAGVTVWVHRYDDHVTIQEQHYARFAHIDKPLITWRYDNVEKARLMLSKRYSIKVGHKELKTLDSRGYVVTTRNS